MYLKDKLKWIPFLMALLIIPITMRLVAVQIPFDVQLNWTGATVDYDIFSYAKSILIFIFAIVTSIILFFSVNSRNIQIIKKGKIFFGVIGFLAIMAILSTFFGGNCVISLGGAPSRYEGLYTFIGYFIFCVYAILFDYDKKSVKLITVLLAVFTVLCALIGFCQYTGNDFFTSDMGTKLIVPEALKDLRSSLQSTKTSFKTMYIFTTHYNYASMLTAMLSMFWLSYFLATKDKFYKILTLIMSILSVLMLLGSNARSGIVAAAVSMVILFFVHLKTIISNKKILIGVVVFIILAIAGASKLGLMSRFGYLVSDLNKIESTRKVSKDYIKELIPLKNISKTDTTYTITWNDGKNDFTLNYDKNADVFSDKDGNKLILIVRDNGTIGLQDKRYSIVTLLQKKTQITEDEPMRTLQVVTIANEKFNFDITNNVKIVNHMGQEINPNQQFLRAGLYGFEKLGSGRGYIIDYTLPLLKKAMIIGYGPDAFLQVFNQDDIYTKFYVYGMTSHVVDKPHNIYLLYAINFGVIATLAFVGMLIYLTVKSAIKYKSFDISKNPLAVGALSGVVAYMMSGFFNDSTVSVSTIFFIFLGIAINSLLKGE